MSSPFPKLLAPAGQEEPAPHTRRYRQWVSDKLRMLERMALLVENQDLSLPISVKQLSKHYIATTSIGGVQVRGKLADDEEGAVRNLLWELSRPPSENEAAMLAIECLISGKSLYGTPAAPALNSGGQQ